MFLPHKQIIIIIIIIIINNAKPRPQMGRRGDGLPMWRVAVNAVMKIRIP
jgi:hypothetical protein